MDMQQMTLAVVEHYQDYHGTLGYDLFRAVQRYLFPDDVLPWPLVMWGLTAHGQCLGWTRSHEHHPPMILLHPTLLAASEKEAPWGVPASWLGVLFALDVMIHECMHVAVNYTRGPWQGGESSHNNPLWIAEVNRLAPLLGWPDVVAAISKPVREGKKLVRRSPGSTIPFDAASKFPEAVRVFRGEADAYYTARHLPFPVDLPQRWRDRYTQPEPEPAPTPALPETVSNNGQAHDQVLLDATSNTETSPTDTRYARTDPDRDFNPEVWSLQSLCDAGHNWRGTGQSVKARSRDHTCRECKVLSNRKTGKVRRQATRQPVYP